MSLQMFTLGTFLPDEPLLCVSYNQSHKKRKDSPEARTIFSLTLILTWTFEGDQSDSASTFFKIASASWF